MLDKSKVYYLAHLYSLDVGLKETEEEKIALLEERFDDANRITCEFLNEGYKILSPISMFHTMAMKYNVPKTGDFWEKIDLALLDRCDGIIIAVEEGFHRSVGVMAERKYAMYNDKEVYHYNAKHDSLCDLTYNKENNTLRGIDVLWRQKDIDEERERIYKKGSKSLFLRKMDIEEAKDTAILLESQAIQLKEVVSKINSEHHPNKKVGFNMNQTERIFHLVHDYLCGDDGNVIRVKGNGKSLANQFEEGLKENSKFTDWQKSGEEDCVGFSPHKLSQDGICICDHEKYQIVNHQDVCIECYNEFDY